MRAALVEAAKGSASTSPNPAVGAVLVLDGKIIARGHHRIAGGRHAEVACLTQTRRAVPSRAVLYVTLEPCSSVGRTPPCTEAILRSGVRNLVIGAVDVNPLHRGRGIESLKQGGLNVRVGILGAQCTALNEAFNKWIVTKHPFVIAKCAMSLDGRLTRPPQESRWLTATAARRDVHLLRSKVDAILVGANTVRTDNPMLTVRGFKTPKQPWRVVLTRSGKLPAKSRVLSDRGKERTLIYRNRSLGQVLSDLGKREVTSVLIEGGGQVLSQALDAGLIDKLQIYLAPRLTGGPAWAFAGRGYSRTDCAPRLERVAYRRLGPDVCVIGYPNLRSTRQLNIF